MYVAGLLTALAIGQFLIVERPTEDTARESALKLLRAAAPLAGRDPAAAVEQATRAIRLDPELAEAYYFRGRERFRLGKIKDSVADFDHYVKLRPKLESRQWERGIAMYYAGQYQRGAKQFELYQTYHDNDVENSVWRYLCMCPTEGTEKSRAALLPIENDRRVPMMMVYAMYRGKASPDDLLAAIQDGAPSPDELARREFYGHLYLGLYHESLGNKTLARKYVLKSADEHKDNQGINRYMWDVARIHADRLRKQAAPK